MTESKELLGRVFYFAPRDCYRLDVTKNGHRKSFYSKKAGLAGKKDCVRKALDWLASAASPVVTQRTTVDSLYQRYLADKALETVDVRNIKSRYENHIKPIIGGISILQLSRQDLKRVITTGFRVGELSRKSLTNLRGDLSSFCNYLDFSNIRHDLRTSNIPIPRGAKKGKKNTLTAKDLYLLFTCTDTVLRHKSCRDDLLYAYRFHVLYGPRPGELMGLHWGDVDFKNNVIHIRRSINEKGKTTDGKNEYAARDLPMTRKAKELLIAQMVYRYDPDDPTERVFGDYSEITYRWRWKLFCECNGITYVTPYELRHSFASVNKMMPLWMLDAVMGHAHEGMSLGVYKYYKKALQDGTHIAYLIFDGNRFVGAGGVSFFQVMPTYHNPSGKKAYIMNMYTHPDYRRQGIAYRTLDLLVKDAKRIGITAISLEATDMGRPLYEKYGFVQMCNEMELPE